MSLDIVTETAGIYRDATEETLERVVMAMQPANSFLILQRADLPEQFAQAALERARDGRIIGDGRFVVEYSTRPGSQWQAKLTDRARVHEAMAGWAFDRSGWQDGLAWEKLDLGF